MRKWALFLASLLVFALLASEADGYLIRGMRFQNLISMGDSLTASTGSTGGATYPFDVANSWSPQRWYYNGGVGGDTSSQILTRYLALDSNYQNGTLLIWSGRNNYNNSAQVQADIAAMVVTHNAAGGNNRDVVLSVINGEYATEHSGQAGYNQIAALDAALATTYSARFIDVRGVLVAAYNPANTMDVADHAADVPPYTLRANNLNGTLTQALNSSDTTFTTSATFSASYVLAIDSEYILVNTVAGTTVSSATRGYGGSTAAGHSNGAAIAGTDPIHLNNAGYAIVAGAVAPVVRTNGW